MANMTEVKYFLDPIPETSQYLIYRCEDGKIVDLAVRSTEYLIEKWGKNHSDAETIVRGLRDHCEIELFD